MLSKIVTAGLAAISLLFTSSAWAEVRVKVDTAPGSVQESAARVRCDHWGDANALTVNDGAGAPVIFEFCSSYGIGDAAHMMDARGRHYVVLEHATGRGTNAVTRYLTVFRFDNRELTEAFRMPIENPIGLQSRFKYSYILRKARRGGIDIVLRGAPMGRAAEGLEDAVCCVPPDRTRVVRIDGFK